MDAQDLDALTDLVGGGRGAVALSGAGLSTEGPTCSRTKHKCRSGQVSTLHKGDRRASRDAATAVALRISTFSRCAPGRVPALGLDA
jgi:hypothetical protein